MNTLKKNLYLLSTGKPVISLSAYSSPIEEYQVAFENRAQPFLEYYYFDGKLIKKRAMTRGEFWDLACSGAVYLLNHGASKGDRVLHCFSHNSLHDAVFRLAAVLAGCVPVTINWQVDDNERIISKAKITDAKFLIYDEEFANRVQAIESKLPTKFIFEAKEIEAYRNVGIMTFPKLDHDDEKMVIFTSGSTAEPKGVSLPYRSYLTNKLTFEQYFGIPETAGLGILLVNPLHHANSTALLDWGMRRSGTIIHLIQRYSTLYWKILADVAKRKHSPLIVPTVSRHFDFLSELCGRSESPVAEDEIKRALRQTDILIGSAPVGPTTVKRVMKFSHHLPIVRFGSTETCLQVMATPRTLSYNELMKAFEAGWSHCYHGEKIVGYYIGREHFPFTRVKVVRAIDPENKAYLSTCDIGEPGYLITQGPNIMSRYTGNAEATESVFREGWYTGLRDIAFALRNETDGQMDYYWMARDSTLLIRGGANYAYDQVAAELSSVLVEDFHLKTEQFKLAVIGLRVESEHEDSCCVTIELSQEVTDKQPLLEANFAGRARERVHKGFLPDYVRFARIPTNFKGLVLVPELKQDFKKSLESKGLIINSQ